MSAFNVFLLAILTIVLCVSSTLQSREKYLYGCQQGAMRYCSFLAKGCSMDLLDDVQTMCREDLE